MLRIRHRTGPKWHLRASHTLASSVYVLLASLNIFVLKKRYEEARGRTHFRPILPLQPDCVPIQSFYSPSSVPLPPNLTNCAFFYCPCSALCGLPPPFLRHCSARAAFLRPPSALLPLSAAFLRPSSDHVPFSASA